MDPRSTDPVDLEGSPVLGLVDPSLAGQTTEVDPLTGGLPYPCMVTDSAVRSSYV